MQHPAGQQADLSGSDGGKILLFAGEMRFQFPIRFPEDTGLPADTSKRQRVLMRNIRVPAHLNSEYFFDLE
jgi:hypothetical protein